MPLHVFGDEGIVDNFFAAGAVGIKRPNAIRFTHGTLSPGAYINNRVLPSHPSLWKSIMLPMIERARMLRRDYDVVASVATGGIAHSSVIAWELGVPHFIVKKQAKQDYGIGGLIDGDVSILHAGTRALLVEDMGSTLESWLNARQALYLEGIVVTHGLLLNTWGLPSFLQNTEDHSIHVLYTGEMFLEWAIKERVLDNKHAQIMRRWLTHPEDESWSHTGEWVLPKKK